ncbi:MAG TPA: outer membrane beta-barrel domain-containing protein [Gammaproteobacteria bacterium]|nr:outer membrane beta-barrel domain-containing protein [Gammaproteobacteria bacterium]
MPSKLNHKLNSVLALLLLITGGSSALAAPPTNRDIITPNVERREIKPPQIEVDDIEVGGFVGLYSAEDFGANAVVGIFGTYHLTEDIFIQGTVGVSTVTSETADLLGQTILQDDGLTYLNVLFGYNILPGEVFAQTGRAWTSSAYFVAGLGTTKLNNDSNFTLVLGGGLRMVPIDWLAVHIDFRDHIYKTTILDIDKTTHNIELSVGASYFF